MLGIASAGKQTHLGESNSELHNSGMHRAGSLHGARTVIADCSALGIDAMHSALKDKSRLKT